MITEDELFTENELKNAIREGVTEALHDFVLQFLYFIAITALIIAAIAVIF